MMANDRLRAAMAGWRDHTGSFDDLVTWLTARGVRIDLDIFTDRTATGFVTEYRVDVAWPLSSEQHRQGEYTAIEWIEARARSARSPVAALAVALDHLERGETTRRLLDWSHWPREQWQTFAETTRRHTDERQAAIREPRADETTGAGREG